MQTVTFKGNVETAYGQTLPKPVSFEGIYEAFEAYDEVVKANEIPSNDDVVKIVNAQRKANARAKGTADALSKAGFEKPSLADSPDLRLAEMTKIFVAAGNSEDVARQKAKAALGM